MLHDNSLSMILVELWNLTFLEYELDIIHSKSQNKFYKGRYMESMEAKITYTYVFLLTQYLFSELIFVAEYSIQIKNQNKVVR
jgi:hypothetical protein